MSSMKKDDGDDIAARILAQIAALPPHEQVEAVHALIGGAIKEMPLDAIQDVRDEIASQFGDCDLPLITSTLNLIDGQIELRRIAGRAHWR